MPSLLQFAVGLHRLRHFNLT